MITNGSATTVFNTGAGANNQISALTTLGALVDLRDGGGTAPQDTTLNPPVKISRQISLTAAQVSGSDGAEAACALEGICLSPASTAQVQAVGLMGAASSGGQTKVGGLSPDAAGGYFRGVTNANGVGVAIGGFFSCRNNSSAVGAAATGVEIQVTNNSGSSQSVQPTAFPPSSALWLVANGGQQAACAIDIGNPFGIQFDTGLHFNGQVTTLTGGIATNCIRDDSHSVTSYLDAGTHTNGIDLSGATYSGVAFKIASGHLIQLANNTTGAGSALLGSNCPAVTVSAPYTWIRLQSGDGSTVFIPAWK